jgi:hypothetical protein
MNDYSYSICCPGSYIKRFIIHKQAISNSDLAEPKRNKIVFVKDMEVSKKDVSLNLKVLMI